MGLPEGEEGVVYNINIKPGTKVLNKSGGITRLSQSFINEQIAKGIGVVYGTDPRGRTEFAILDKNAIESIDNSATARVGMGTETFNQSNDPQVELRKIYGYRDSHLAPDADGGYSGANIEQAYPDINSRTFAKEYGDGFSYDSKAVKAIRDMQKNPDAPTKTATTSVNGEDLEDPITTLIKKGGKIIYLKMEQNMQFIM